MGRGDQRSRQGKVRRGTYGKTRPRKANKRKNQRRAAAAAGTTPRPTGGAGAGR